jgi:hypothetical protein
MSDEEMNQKMEFIVEQQAQFAADIQVMREVQAQDAKLLKDALLGLVDIVGGLARTQMQSEARVNLLTSDLSRLAQAQAQTEESLKILMHVVERHIHGNGGSAHPS